MQPMLTWNLSVGFETGKMIGIVIWRGRFGEYNRNVGVS